MAQPDAQSSHGATESDADAEVRCCPVCTEPAGWVAVGPCGHREVCVNCAVRMRFFEDDRRCCICRALCPTVIITRSDDSGQQEGAFVKPSAGMFTGAAGRALGKYFWYHGGMAAYFDDREQYEAARTACSLTTSAAGPADVDERPEEAPAAESCPWYLESSFLVALAMLTITAGFMAMCVAELLGLIEPAY